MTNDPTRAEHITRLIKLRAILNAEWLTFPRAIVADVSYIVADVSYIRFHFMLNCWNVDQKTVIALLDNENELIQRYNLRYGTRFRLDEIKKAGAARITSHFRMTNKRDLRERARKDTIIALRLSKDLLDALDAAARKSGDNRSETLREFIRSGLNAAT